MRNKRIVSIVLAVLTFLCSTYPATAATTSEDILPDAIYYRAKPRDTFEGEIDIRSGIRGDVAGVEISEGEDPAFYVYDYDNDTAYFDSLFKSAEQTLVVTKADKTYTALARLAVYDRVVLRQGMGSVTLTVKDNKTFQPISGAEYTLYQEGKSVRSGLRSDTSGKITITDLSPGSYELRPAKSPSGYQDTSKSIPFEIGGLQLGGGETEIRTTSGKKVSAEDNEILIAGMFSPDVKLTSTQGEQISSITASLANYGATTEKLGKTLEKEFASASELEDFLNTEKKEGKICGEVNISCTLRGTKNRSTCNYVQYLAAYNAAEPEPTPTPTPVPSAYPAYPYYPYNPNYGYDPNYPYVTPAPQATTAPVPEVSTSPNTSPTPNQRGSLLIAATTNSGYAEGLSFDVTGMQNDGTSYSQSFQTDAAGEITVNIPVGTYTISLRGDSSSNISVGPTKPQEVIVTADSTAYVAFDLEMTERTFTILVVDDDGIPVPGVTVGIFTPITAGAFYQEPYSKPDDDATDISAAISQRQQEEAEAELLANPYARSNALALAISSDAGIAEFTRQPTSELIAAVVAAPEGYAIGSKPSSVPGDWKKEYHLVCEYVKVDVKITNLTTGEPPLGATAAIMNSRDVELASWEVDRDPHRLIRVPAGSYDLRLLYGDSEETFSLVVEDSEPLQLVEIDSSTTGSVDIEKPPADEEGNRHLLQIGLIAGGSALALALIVAAIMLWRKKRRRTGGYQ